MALNIRDPEVHDLARKVASAAGETMTEAVRKALEERLARIAQVSVEERRRRLTAMRDFAELYRRAPIQDPRTPDEILGYDETGLPT